MLYIFTSTCRDKDTSEYLTSATNFCGTRKLYNALHGCLCPSKSGAGNPHVLHCMCTPALFDILPPSFIFQAFVNMVQQLKHEQIPLLAAHVAKDCIGGSRSTSGHSWRVCLQSPKHCQLLIPIVLIQNHSPYLWLIHPALWCTEALTPAQICIMRHQAVHTRLLSASQSCAANLKPFVQCETKKDEPLYTLHRDTNIAASSLLPGYCQPRVLMQAALPDIPVQPS